jgi:uncharacterized repeat protein (TIGR03803 family)
MNPKNARSAWGLALIVVASSLILVSGAQAASTMKILHYFQSTPAYGPEATLVSDNAGNLYGTTDFSAADTCGNAGCGTIFKLTKLSGGNYQFGVIHRFHGSDGQRPTASLIFDAQGNLYGTTYLGGAYGAGTVFELSPSGTGWKEKVLYSFNTSGDLQAPLSAVIFDGSGNLFGSCNFGAAHGQGGVFELTPNGSGWKEQVLYSFTGGTDGGGYIGNLVFDAAGNLYSTAASGGTVGQGVVFELSPSSGGTWTETVLYNFTGESDGASPAGGVIFDGKGSLYGTTSLGPPSSCDGGLGCGTVYQLTPSTTGWTLSVLHTFDGTDGDAPWAPMTFDNAGNLYGTTTTGGSGHGVVFKLSPLGSSWTETVLLTFNQSDGALPYGGLILDKQGVLYGSASIGGMGSFGYGVLFSIKQ